MPKKAMELLTETMFYCLMAFSTGPMCGADVAEKVKNITDGRIRLGPATLYTILAKFEKEGYILETQVERRKRTYKITLKGRQAYVGEMERLKTCLRDAEREELNNRE